MRRVTLSFPWPLSPQQTSELLSYAFAVSLVTYIVFSFLETLQPGFVSTSLSLNTCFWVVVALGAGAMFWPHIVEPDIVPSGGGIRAWFAGVSTSVLVGLVVYLKARHTFGVMSGWLAIVTTVFFFCSYFLLIRETEGTSHGHKKSE